MKRHSTAVVYDLDGTLRDNSHRRYLAPENPSQDSDWDKWSLACGDDTPIAGMIRRMELDWLQHQVHIVTACGVIASDLTRAWLAEYVGPAYDYLQMRRRNDFRRDYELKIEYITLLRAEGVEVVLAYEDRKDIADKIAAETEVPVVLVNPAYEWIEVLRDQRL